MWMLDLFCVFYLIPGEGCVTHCKRCPDEMGAKELEIPGSRGWEVQVHEGVTWEGVLGDGWVIRHSVITHTKEVLLGGG